MSTIKIEEAIRASTKICFFNFFYTYTWLNRPQAFFTEFPDSWFGNYMIAGTKWRDYLHPLLTMYFDNVNVINVTGTLVKAGITLTSSSLTRSNNNIVMYYEGLAGRSVTLQYKDFTYNIPTSIGKNYLYIKIELSQITVYDETGGTTNIGIMVSDPPVASEEWTLQMSNITLYGLNLFQNLSDVNLLKECDNIKILANKRLLS